MGYFNHTMFSPKAQVFDLDDVRVRGSIEEGNVSIGELGRQFTGADETIIEGIISDWKKSGTADRADAAELRKHAIRQANAMETCLAALVNPGMSREQFVADRADAADEFETSGLEVLLPQQNIVLSDSKKYLFVPGKTTRRGANGELVAGPPLIPVFNYLPIEMRENVVELFTMNSNADFVDPENMRELGTSGYKSERKRNRASWFGSRYTYSVTQEWRDKALGRNSADLRRQSAEMGLDDMQEKLAGSGNSERGLFGLWSLNDALIIDGGPALTRQSIGADPQGFMYRLAMFDQLYKRYNDEESAMRAVLPEYDRIAMQNTWMGDIAPGRKVWDEAVDMYDWLRNAVFTNKVIKANAEGNGSRWTLWADNAAELYQEQTSTLIFGPFQRFMSWDFFLLRKTGCVVSRRPNRVMYVDFQPVAP